MFTGVAFGSASSPLGARNLCSHISSWYPTTTTNGSRWKHGERMAEIPLVNTVITTSNILLPLSWVNSTPLFTLWKEAAEVAGKGCLWLHYRHQSKTGTPMGSLTVPLSVITKELYCYEFRLQGDKIDWQRNKHSLANNALLISGTNCTTSIHRVKTEGFWCRYRCLTEDKFIARLKGSLYSSERG